MKTCEWREDFAALYDLICEGHEVLGYMPIGGYNEVFRVMHNREQQEVWIKNTNLGNSLITTADKDAFLAECTRLRLQYVPPTTK